MAYSLAQAAAATGRDRSTLLKAIKSGKLSASRDSATGAWRVDPSELARVYGIGNSEANSESGIGAAQPDMRLQLEVERTRSAGLEARLADMEGGVADLRQRLDTESEERRRLTAILTDMRPKPDQETTSSLAAPRRRWWPWRRQ